MGRIEKKSTKMSAIKKLQIRITKYIMCIYERHKCTCLPSIKFVRLNLWLEEVCTDHTNTNANDDDETY